MMDACNNFVDKDWFNMYVNIFINFAPSDVSLIINKINMSIPITVNVTFTGSPSSSPNFELWRKNTMMNEIHIIK